jgi:hypothetical protein
MDEKENIINFLNRYYRVELSKFYDINLEKNIYGHEILEHLIVVFSLNPDELKLILTEWGLSNMTIQDFENNWEFKRPIPEIALYEPKRMNRFLIAFPEDFNIPVWGVSEASRPFMKLISKKIFGFKLSKSLQWDDLVIKLRDPIGPSTSQSLMELIHPDLKNKHKVKEKFSLQIEMLDPTGVVVEKWQLDNCEFKSIDFGKLSYDNDNLVTCTLTIKLKDVVLLF